MKEAIKKFWVSLMWRCYYKATKYMDFKEWSDIANFIKADAWNKYR